MRFMFKFPDIGEGITEGQIVEWRVKKGQRVKTGEALVEMETDKVVTEIPSPRDGVVVTLFGTEGDTINVDDPLVELELEGVTAEEMQEIARSRPAPPTREAVDEGGAGGVVGTIEVAGEGGYLPASDEGFPRSQPTESGRPRDKVLATPVARAVAKSLSIDINQVSGTGPAGRVTREDVQRHADQATSSQAIPMAGPARTGTPSEETPDVSYESLSGIRKAIARHMVESKRTAAHMTVTEEAEISALVELRAANKGPFAERGIRLTYLTFVARAVAVALRRHPSLNSRLDLEQGRMILNHRIHLGIAVDAPDGLVVPVIRDVDRMRMSEIAGTIEDYSERARSRGLSMEEMRGGTFTITSFGGIGGLFAAPIINYPEVAILGVGRIHTRPVFDENGSVVTGTIMPLSLSVDHRAVDGGDAARFLTEIVRLLSSPASMFID